MTSRGRPNEGTVWWSSWTDVDDTDDTDDDATDETAVVSSVRPKVSLSASPRSPCL